MSTPDLEGLVKQATGRTGLVYGTPEWDEEKQHLEPTEHVVRALARLGLLGGNRLEDVARMNWVTFPMQGRPGFFEVRIKGVRFYGARVARWGKRDLLLLLGAEQKAGKTKADDSLLDACEKRLERDRAKLEALARRPQDDE